MKLVYVGPLTPPVHGKALATQVLARSLAARGVEPYFVDTSEGTDSNRLRKLVRKLRAHAHATSKVVAVDAPVYATVNSSGGMWLTIVVALAARLARRPLFLHHHSYDYVRDRRFRMAALCSVAGRNAHHIALGRGMANDLRRTYPEVGATLVLNNAGLVDGGLLDLPTEKAGAIVLGHLSNLTAEKGVEEVVEHAIAARRAHPQLRLVLAGPATDDAAQSAIARAEAELGGAFDYRGPLYGPEKRRFFAEITHFVFPTRYRHEASPLVLLEAMAAGVPSIAFARGCVRNDLGRDGGMVVEETDSFVVQAMTFIKRPVDPVAVRGRYLELLREHEEQVADLVAALAKRL